MKHPFAQFPPRLTFWGALLLALATSSCSNLRTTGLNNDYDTRTRPGQRMRVWRKPSFGSSPLIRYYLPIPYIQVYAYEVRLLGKETLRVGFRSVVAPDLNNPLLIDHNFGGLVDDNLQITTSPEGLLEYVGYRREPKVVQAAATVARMALSMGAPLPGSFKGDDGLPEFSRLVFKKNYKIEDCGMLCPTQVLISGRCFEISADRLESVKSKEASFATEDFKHSARGLYHRPLMPVVVTIRELHSGDKARPNSRELLRATNNLPGLPFVLNEPTSPNRKAAVLDKPSEDEREAIEKLKGNTTNLVALERSETAIHISDVVYCPDPSRVDTFFIPTAIFAPQAFEIQLAGGSVYDVKVRRRSEVLALVDGLNEFAGSFVRVPANLFTFTVVHENGSGGGSFDGGIGSGSKDPDDYRPKREKDPDDYRPKREKD
jgi:hypothetical protein